MVYGLFDDLFALQGRGHNSGDDVILVYGPVHRVELNTPLLPDGFYILAPQAEGMRD